MDERSAGQQTTTAPARDAREGRKALTAGCIGTFVEFYDFSLYAYAATIIATLFFPEGNRTAALLGTFGIFAVTFFFRPVGGIFFGNMGDRIGRRNTLATVILLMGAATVLMGLLPTYGQVGIWAPILLFVLRLFQGFSAGGEFSGAATFLTEYAPHNRRGLWASFIGSTAVFGFVIGGLISLLFDLGLSDAALNSWGWRVPFLLAGPVALIGLYMRLRLDETPAFQAIEEAHQVESVPILDVLRNHLGSVALLVGVAMVNAVAFYTVSSYLATYLIETIGLDRTPALLSNSLALMVYVLGAPLFGMLSDRVGRKPVLLTGCAGILVLSLPGYLLIGSGGLGAAILGQMMLALPLTIIAACVVVVQVELFPTKLRYSGASVGYNVAYAIFGGTAPFVGAFLVAQTGSNLSPAWYGMAIAAVAFLIIVLKLPETHRLPMLRGEEAQALGGGLEERRTQPT
jgi:MFS transporter, MHS family, proline/betaine transporter